MSDSCETCNLYRKQNVKEPLINHDIPNEPWIKVGIDLFYFNKRNYLLVLDYYSKFIEISNLNMNTTTNNIRIVGRGQIQISNFQDYHE